MGRGGLIRQSRARRLYSVSAVIACYKDAQAIPIMAERWHAVGLEEHDLFMRGLCAYVGFRQTGVPYTGGNG